MDKRDELIVKLEELEHHITKCDWSPIEFAGYWQILDSDHYDSNDILDSANYGEPQAKANAELMSLAPVMMKYIMSLKAEVEKEKQGIKCLSCGEPISQYCERCKTLWES